MGKFNAKSVNSDQVKDITLLYSGAALPYEKNW